MQHDHDFLGKHHEKHERRTRWVIAVTVVTMVVEIAAGHWSGSMALLADGWHMATHAGALTITALAYAWARRHARDPAYAFSTGKVGDLAGFASAVALGAVSLWIGGDSLLRLWHPVAIAFDEAIAVAVLGLLVNVLCAVLLGGEHTHAHEHDDHDDHDDHDHAHGDAAHLHADHNLRSAYLHVLADGLTSVLAIGGLLAGRFLGWAWLDPAVGMLGALMIARWSVSLMRDTAAVLLDRVPGPALLATLRERLERDGDTVTDLHVWRVGPGHLAVIAAVATARGTTPAACRTRLADVPHLAHVTIEVEPRA